jgi:HSP20 family protein
MLMRFDPFRDFDSLAQMLGQRGGPARPSPIPMDAYRDGDRFVIHFDLPGVDPSSIDLTVEKNVLTVRAERSWPASESQEVIARERPEGVFVRQLFLGEGLDTDQVQATYHNGVLTITIPVAEQAKPRKVEVVGADGEQPIEPVSEKEQPQEVTSAA